jgi:signal transduction histidine kinase/ActR/RegA family two-component response regulator
MIERPQSAIEIELAALNKRLRQLAEEKSFLQLSNSLFCRLIQVSGVENRQAAILQGLMTVIGGTYIALYYQIDNVMHFTDITGAKRRLAEVDDPLVRCVLRSGTPVEKESDFEQTRMLTNEFTRANTWVYPLKIDTNVIGAIRIDHLHLTSQRLSAYLPTLFGFIALCLQSEITGQSQLKRANEELKLEIEQRKKIEEQLELRVAERTAELQRRKNILSLSQSFAHVGGWEWDVATQTLTWTDETYRIHDLAPPGDQSGHPVSGDELIATSVRCYLPEDRETILHAFRRCVEQGQPYDLELPFITYSGRKRWIRTTGKAIYAQNRITQVIGNILDITDQKQHEKERLKIEKLESLGVLAGGIAHDFNNALTGILGHLSLAQRRIDPEHRAAKCLEQAQKSCVKAASLANQLLTFARGGAPAKTRLNLGKLLEEIIVLEFQNSDINVDMQIEENLHPLVADADQLAQALRHLAANARDAMPDGGRFSVQAGNTRLDPGNSHKLPAGSYLRLVFSDQGCGISEDNQQRIFDPYFTTKTSGHGLGLAATHSIIQRHQGQISVSSTPGQGARFTIYLPAIEVDDAESPHLAPEAAAAERISACAQATCILVMDDEEMIRELVTEVLDSLGYQTTCAADGAEAINCYQKALNAGKPFAAGILDLTIPGGMGGKEAAARILALDPEACLIVSSGYSDDPVMANCRDYGFCAAVAKPYQIAELENCLARLTCHRQ